jgi:hypothetical protein
MSRAEEQPRETPRSDTRVTRRAARANAAAGGVALDREILALGESISMNRTVKRGAAAMDVYAATGFEPVREAFEQDVTARAGHAHRHTAGRARRADRLLRPGASDLRRLRAQPVRHDRNVLRRADRRSLPVCGPP